jgi:catechol 2,3-dioxygenase-like lactoylglutathione lyase family enzyme
MIDHVTLNVRDYERSKRFYLEALKPLDYELVMEFEKACGIGAGGKPDFWIGERGEASAPVHVALVAPDRKTVDAFHAAAIAAGGKDNGPPGLRPHYHEHYYAAFAHDPDGNNVEAVCHMAE